ncbi:hypothetical protein, partial [Salmonella enterica]|uniref:hypothetical protein n=1 Tax=Salmonella enterica TaxID=28901 RepID=UPI00398C4CDB
SENESGKNSRKAGRARVLGTEAKREKRRKKGETDRKTRTIHAARRAQEVKPSLSLTTEQTL